jgi:predicted acyl esterase
VRRGLGQSLRPRRRYPSRWQATRVTFGVLNLAHRDGNADPEPMEPGKKTRSALVLDACGYRFGVGHRIRLSLSTAYWPMILPPPPRSASADGTKMWS